MSIKIRTNPVQPSRLENFLFTSFIIIIIIIISSSSSSSSSSSNSSGGGGSSSIHIYTIMDLFSVSPNFAREHKRGSTVLDL